MARVPIPRSIPLLAALLAVAPVAGADEPPLVWSPPVRAEPSRRFAPGTGPFEVSGHAGVDYDVPPGTPVAAAGDGTVAFVGQVAGATFVVLAHGGGVRTTYGQLATATVRCHDSVRRGDVVGTAGGGGMHDHPDGVLHFGLRIDGRPADPLQLFAPPDLTQVVRLVPTRDTWAYVGGATAERRLAAAWFAPPLTRPAWLYGAGDGGSGVGRVLGAAASLVGDGVTIAAGLPVDAASLGAALAWEVGAGVGDWWDLRGDCTVISPGGSSPGGAAPGHRVVVVAGVNSSTRPDGSTASLDPQALGYAPADVTWFSYAEDGGAYERADTHVGPAAAATRLADQLRPLAGSRAGSPVDLIGHSQGGVVVEGFLKEHYAGHEADFPPIGRVVTLAAPHRGTPLGRLAGRVVAAPGADAAARLLGFPGPGAPTTTQLAEGSGYIERLRQRPLPAGVDVTTIGATGDWLVTADQTRLDGADHVVVDPAGVWSDHRRVLDDPEAVGALRLALAGAPPPCRSLPEAVRDRVVPRTIHGAYELVTP